MEWRGINCCKLYRLKLGEILFNGMAGLNMWRCHWLNCLNRKVPPKI
jgi:hypothetical protein